MLDRTGSAVPGATVTLTRVGGQSQQASTDGKGRFAFPRLLPGDYQLSCLPAGSGFAEILDQIRNPPETFTVEAGEDVERNVTVGA